MKTLITITLLFFNFLLQAQTKFQQERDSIRALPEIKNRDFQFARLEVVKELRFVNLQDREKLLLLDHIEDAYFRFNSGKKEIDSSALLAFMESENPVCKWSGIFEEVEEGRLVKVYKVDMKIILQIFDL